MKDVKITGRESQSAFLIGNWLYNTVLKARALKGKKLAKYLHKLLSDPFLEYKLSFLNSKKSKKQYQEAGQDLIPVYFFPDECDWAHLSLISNATGFSRCYIFVYLMLLDCGILKIKKNKTKDFIPVSCSELTIQCVITLNRKEKKLTRGIKPHDSPRSGN